MPASSMDSRMAAPSRVSPASTKPPGKTHLSVGGLDASFEEKELAVLPDDCAGGDPRVQILDVAA